MKVKKLLTIDILGYQFNIVEDGEIVRRGKEGECDMEKELITINPNQSRRGIADTLLHEILHVINGTGLDAENQLNEMQVTYFGTVLAEVLRRNPQLQKILTE